ncbi:hypothetical protein L249_3032, partial [Ophiocordyceps polyrhachis-furcata BCC 54312]
MADELFSPVPRGFRGRVALPLQLWGAGYWSCYPPRRLGRAGGLQQPCYAGTDRQESGDPLSMLQKSLFLCRTSRRLLLLLDPIIITMANARCPGY